ncbi:Toluene-4-sulfonate monooxygenase system iron-sulfur subunit TsaM1 [Variovorax sp. SRS16]|uniref:aromatic ring-hydroxylating dioxygenase subunit alpha n=1 Tax=Variovorax sp. SRS16 TaxID=282217 RepID=UPI0013169B3B|nr:aromatic ring-hydroxylating dioxygenase subunit alpha [Variovorax sp. SRS16]VTU22250.1 Toluene-4-sulfonate monooxygenase system iron-sulfur subunit TsaM1 [Variovorax sp. SRS16]
MSTAAATPFERTSMKQYVYNTWYPLAWARDVRHELTKRRVLEEDIVVFRGEDGRVAALEDACPHRLAPLSLGTLRGNAVECGYHGLTFDCSGRCVRVPGQDTVPASIQVRAYPTTESMGMVWIWMGKPELADRSAVFHLPQYDDPKFSVVEGDALHVDASYLSLADNLCDPSHVTYVHRSTLASEGRIETPVQDKREGNKVVTWRWVIDGPLIPVFNGLKDFGGNVDRWHYYHYHAPSIAVIDFGSAKTGTGAPEGDLGDCIQMFACHFITPIDERSCTQHWLCLKNSPADPAIDARLMSDLRMTFDEDKRILEAIQRNEDKLQGRRTIRLGIDSSSIKMRRIVQEMAAD